MVKVVNRNKTFFYVNTIFMGAVWIMVYTSVLYSMVYIQSLIDPLAGDHLKTWDAVEDKYLEIMGISMAILLLVTPILGYFNDKQGAENLIPVIFFAHAIFACSMYYGIGENPSTVRAFSLGFFLTLLTVSAAVAVLSNYARDLPADIRGTMMGFLALGSQLIAFVFIQTCKHLINLLNVASVSEGGELTAYMAVACVDLVMVLIGSCMICKAKNKAKKAKKSKK